MSDPAEIAQQAQHQASVVHQAGGPGGVLGAILGALTVIGGLWRIVFGTRKERADEQAQEDSAAERAAELALRMASRADEETASHKRALGTCEEQLAAMRAEIRARDEATAEAFRLMREELAAIRAENTRLRREQEVARGMLADLMRNASTPPHGLYTPDDVRAAMAQEDDHG